MRNFFWETREKTFFKVLMRLVGEQSNAYRILLRYDRKSRHRRIKKQRRYERLAATSQFVKFHLPLTGRNSSYLGLPFFYKEPASYRAFKCCFFFFIHLWLTSLDFQEQ